MNKPKPTRTDPDAANPAASGPYDDIIDLPHHVSALRPHMSAMERAAQFSPFAALTGYEAVIKETERLTDRRSELTEEAKAELDRKLQTIASHIDRIAGDSASDPVGAPTGALAGDSDSDSACAGTMTRREQAPEVSVTYFVPDGKKAGGKYVTIAGRVKKIDQNARLLIMEDGTEIPTDDIAEIRL